jgi:hypothetical protein
VATGTLIAESLMVGGSLAGLDVTLVFSGRVFRYPTSDREGRAAAEAHAREHGVPEPQIDWP